MVNMVRVAPTMAEDDPQIAAAKQQVAMALAQMQQGGSAAGVPIASGAGAVQAKYGVGNALADLANKFSQGYALRKANDKYGRLRGEQDTMLSAANKGMVDKLAPTVLAGEQGSVPIALAGLGGGDKSAMMHTPVATADSINPARAKLTSALVGMDPRTMNAALTQLSLRDSLPDPMVQAQRDNTRAQMEMTAEARAEDRAQRGDAADQADATRRDVATGQQDTARAIAKGSQDTARAIAASKENPPSLSEVVDPKDSTRLLKVDAKKYKGGTLGEAGVIGVAGKEPGAAKAAETRGTGQQSVNDLTTGLRDYYRQLQGSGGITDTNKGGASNVLAGVKESGAGQLVGRVFGTKNQSLRNSISQQRPLLLQAIKTATGMSSKQMDSNAELKLWLSAATNPQLDVQSNLRALDNIEKLYGIGSTPPAGGAKPAAAPKGAPAAAAPKSGRVKVNAQGDVIG